MNKSNGDTKSKIIDVGEKLLLKKGFNGFSYADIAEALGIKKASIHYHFPSKCDLGIAVIQRARQRFSGWAERRETAGLSDWEKLDRFFQIYRHYLTTSESVCLSGALETDFTTLPEPMQEETRGLVSDLLTWMDKFLGEGRKHGTFSFPGTSRNQAFVVLAVLQGGLQMNRVVDPAIFDTAAGQIRRMLEP
jgi:TetR/AcrR family transcriptional repressor of nem operon